MLSTIEFKRWSIYFTTEFQPYHGIQNCGYIYIALPAKHKSVSNFRPKYNHVGDTVHFNNWNIGTKTRLGRESTRHSRDISSKLKQSFWKA